MRHIELNGELLEISASECWYVMDDARVEKTYSTSPDQINHDIGVGGTNAFNNLFIKVNIARGRTGFGVANVTMNNSGTSLASLDSVVGDLLGTARHFITAILSATGAGECCGNEDFFSHG